MGFGCTDCHRMAFDLEEAQFRLPAGNRPYRPSRLGRRSKDPAAAAVAEVDTSAETADFAK